MRALESEMFRAIAEANHRLAEELIRRDTGLVRTPGLVRVAVHQNDEEMVRLLLRHGASGNDWEYDDSGNYRRSGLILAIEEGRVAILGAILDQGADPNEPRHHDLRTPLMCAAWSGQAESARLLLERGADVYATDGRGQTALHWAAAAGDLRTLEELLAAGANVAAIDRFGNTPLHESVRDGDRPNVVRLLITRGAAPGAAAHDGTTPMHVAAYKGNVGAVRVLLEAGAAVLTRDEDGDTPYDLALLGIRDSIGSPAERAAAALNHRAVLSEFRQRLTGRDIVSLRFRGWLRRMQGRS